MVYFIYFWQEERIAYDDFILQKQINYAADAAVEEMLMTGDLGTDYATTYVNVQPDLGVDEFCTIMLECFDMPTTDHDKAWVQNHYIKTLIICAYDGLYVYDMKEYATHEHAFLPSPKIPYFYTDFDGTQYTLNFGLEEGYSDGHKEGNYRVNAIGKLPSSITDDQQYAQINDMVSYYLQESLARAYGGDSEKTVQLPAFASEISGGQPIKNISVIGVLETDDNSKHKPNLCMAIGGARIVETDPLVCFYINGVPYYAPQSRVSGFVGDNAIVKTYTSEYDAAKAGFNCYLPAYERVVSK